MLQIRMTFLVRELKTQNIRIDQEGKEGVKNSLIERADHTSLLGLLTYDEGKEEEPTGARPGGEKHSCACGD